MRIDWDIVIFGIIVKALLFACINRLPTRKQLGETQKLLWIPPVDSFQLGGSTVYWQQKRGQPLTHGKVTLYGSKRCLRRYVLTLQIMVNYTPVPTS